MFWKQITAVNIILDDIIQLVNKSNDLMMLTHLSNLNLLILSLIVLETLQKNCISFVTDVMTLRWNIQMYEEFYVMQL